MLYAQSCNEKKQDTVGKIQFKGLRAVTEMNHWTSGDIQSSIIGKVLTGGRNLRTLQFHTVHTQSVPLRY